MLAMQRRSALTREVPMHGHFPASVQDLHRLLQQPRLRVVGVDFEELRHGSYCRRCDILAP